MIIDESISSYLMLFFLILPSLLHILHDCQYFIKLKYISHNCEYLSKLLLILYDFDYLISSHSILHNLISFNLNIWSNGWYSFLSSHPIDFPWKI